MVVENEYIDKYILIFTFIHFSHKMRGFDLNNSEMLIWRKTNQPTNFKTNQPTNHYLRALARLFREREIGRSRYIFSLP